jgi:hypothetical protein
MVTTFHRTGFCTARIICSRLELFTIADDIQNTCNHSGHGDGNIELWPERIADFLFDPEFHR